MSTPTTKADYHSDQIEVFRESKNLCLALFSILLLSVLAALSIGFKRRFIHQRGRGREIKELSALLCGRRNLVGRKVGRGLSLSWFVGEGF